MGVEGVSPSETRAQEYRPRMTSVEAERCNVEASTKIVAKNKAKVGDIRERTDFLKFGYNEDLEDNEVFETPEQRLMEYHADVPRLQLHQGRYKLIDKGRAAEEAAILF